MGGIVIVHHDNDYWETVDSIMSYRIARELKDLDPNREIRIVRVRDGFQKKVTLGEITLEYDY